MTDAATSPGTDARTHYPAHSKMLDMYAGDIAGMLAEGHIESAERQALTLPHIAVALADAALHSSCAGYEDWCLRWVQPDFGSAAYAEWCTRSNQCEGAGSGVPFAALRALRLRRRAREVRPTFARSVLDAQPGKAQVVTCALLGAAFRWYEHEGRHHATVQTNLARLGVLR